MRRTALAAMAIVCLPSLMGCQTMRGWFSKDTTASTDPMQEPDYYADSAAGSRSTAYQDYEPYEPIVTRSADTSPTLSAPMPAEREPAVGTRYHTVSKGDTLYALARRYYSDQRRWKDIFEANRDTISDANKIRVGQRLLIP